MAYTQANRLISIETPLGPDVLLLQGFTGRESISQLFHFTVDLLSEDPSIKFDDIVGQRVTITVRLADGTERYWNGFVSRFAQSGSDGAFIRYEAEVVPWLWFLTRTADCRIFQNMTIPDIVTKIFKDLGFTDFKQMLQGSFQPRDYCVQYRETDFNFVSRLMEQYGIFYFFEHEQKKHTLVMANSNSPTVHQPCPNQATVVYEPVAGQVEEEDAVTSWHVEQEMRPGKYAITDYNFETPSTSLMANIASTISVGGNNKYEIYDYPGEYLKKPEGSDLVKIRMEEEEAVNFVVSGAGSCRAFASGYRFNLTEHYRQDMNKAYVLTQVQHTAAVGEAYTGGESAGGGGYSNHFTCIPQSVPFRPLRVTPKPVVQGVQTAVVVGKSGEEIWTDKYGRVKVQFHWDREGKRDENSSCWIRVSHPWAGKNWGSVSIPRIGQEVIVDFLEGDPDQPIITGRVYNAMQMPPYALPAGGVVSGLKSNSTKGGGGYNEISMDDTKGTEKITIHGQYDMNTTVEHNQTTTVHNNRMDMIGVNDSETVGGNQMQAVGGNRSRTVGKNEAVTVALTRTHTVGVNEAITIGGAQEVTVGGARAVTVGGAQIVSVGASLQERVGQNRTASVGGNDQLSAGKKLTINVGDEIVITTGDSSLRMKKDGTIIVKGKAISIEATQKIEQKATDITSEATSSNVRKGQMVNSEAAATNTIKGALVKIN